MAKAKGPSARNPKPPVLKVTPDIDEDDQRLELLERLQKLVEYKIEYEGWVECPTCEAAKPPCPSALWQRPAEQHGSGI